MLPVSWPVRHRRAAGTVVATRAALPGAALRARVDVLAAGGLFLAALALRAYRLTAQPLWLDELIGVELGRAGLGAMLYIPVIGPHPPLYYLLSWAGAGFGAADAEWAWRWIPMLSGALGVPLLYLLVRQLAGRAAAGLAAFALLLSPAHVYFSQEARPYTLLALVASATSWLLVRAATQPGAPRRTGAFLGLSLAGVYAGYCYALVLAGQLLHLALGRGRARAAKLAVACALVGLPLASVAGGPLGHLAERDLHKEALTPLHVARSMLVYESLRYGSSPFHVAVPAVVAALGAIGVASALRRPALRAPASVHLLPLAAGFLLVFGVLDLGLGVQMSAKDAKQFLPLLPAALVCAALGVDTAVRRLPRPASAILVVALAAGAVGLAADGLPRYWATSKSPEGELALELRDRFRDGDAIVSLHTSLRRALRHYVTELEPAVWPSDAYAPWFGPALPPGSAPPTEAHALVEALAGSHGRLWLLGRRGDERLAALPAGCRAERRLEREPFVAIELRCGGAQPPGRP
jgi:hypothetical protein